MTNCPYEDCREIRELKNDLDNGLTEIKVDIKSDRENKRGWLKWWIGSLSSVIILITASMIITWARADDVPKIKEDAEKRETRVTVLETNQKTVMANMEKMMDGQQKILTALSSIQTDIQNIKDSQEKERNRYNDNNIR